jgi:hypothetical protein
MMKLLFDILRQLFGMKPQEDGGMVPKKVKVTQLDGDVNIISYEGNTPPTKKEIALATIPTFKYFTVEEYLNGHAKWEDLNLGLQENIVALLTILDKLREQYGKPFIISSGYRPEEYNAKIGGASNSAHITGQAIDIRDSGKELQTWLIENTHLIVEYDLYIEKFKFTPTWAHIQIRPTKSGRRFFRP